ncbi:MAG: response regulator transcription factor [Firmicutes bacterium]|nr:response regulator transcription factor [Bacillota bacterium]
MKRILVVDDEGKIRHLLRMYLEAEGFAVGEAADGHEALAMIREGPWDLVVLDLMLPGVDGWVVCKEIRRGSTVPVIMLTARGHEADRVLGLELGADDYVVKPFSPREVVARVKAVLRRASRGEGEERPLDFGALRIDPAAREVRVLGEPVALSPKEFDLLLHLARHPGRVFTREQLLQQVWGYDFFGEARTVDTHVNRLRDKLGSVAGAPSFITTVRGVGYKFEVRP